MATAPPRWVVVDDADASITYTGTWFKAASNSLDNLGNFGPTYLGTSHGTNSTASFSYSFEGSAVNVLGTTNINNSSGIIDPTWECFIDGVSIGSTSPFQYPENNWVLCTWNNKGTSGSHVLTVNATSTGHSFWFDSLQYEPPQSATLQNAVVYLDHQDAAIKYDSSWQSLGGSANMTTTEGSTVTLDFVGTQLSWYGFIPTELPHNPSLGTYTIDGQTSTTFTLKGLATANSGTIYNQQFFQTPVLGSSGPHELVVTFRGDGSSTPLTITNILIQSGSLSVSAPYTASSSSASSKSTTKSSSASTGTISASASASSSHHVSAGAIAGGILGGLGLFLFCLVFVICFRKRRRPKPVQLDLNEKAVIEPFHIPETTSPLLNNSHSHPEGATYKPSTHTSQPSFQSYDPPSTPATSSGGPPSHVSGAARLAHYQPQPLAYPSRKQMEATSSTPTTAQVMSSSGGTPVPTTYSDGTGDSRSRVVLHQDSGIRLPRQEDDVVEVPPLYTPG